MLEFPHDYQVAARAETEGNVVLKAEDLPQLVTASCAASGDTGDQWSPETLLVAAVMDGFILGFRTIANTAEFDWHDLSCLAVGTLDRVDKVNRFTHIRIEAALTVPGGSDNDLAQRLMEKAAAACAIANSLTAETHLELTVQEAA
jgi:organic hydroperoxide reductase OsmC/OhrA